MVPDIDSALIENSGERQFYEAAGELPDEFTVFYGYKFSTGEMVADLEKLEQKIREIFKGKGRRNEVEAVATLKKILAPSFWFSSAWRPISFS